jgi:pyrroloquinoline quinone biosynthesis protein D
MSSALEPGARASVGADVRPRIGPGFRLQWEPAQDCHVLLYPEGMVKLNQSAGEILRRCDGERDVAAIVADLEAAFGAQGLLPEVLAFVEIAGKQRWLAWS